MLRTPFAMRSAQIGEINMRVSLPDDVESPMPTATVVGELCVQCCPAESPRPACDEPNWTET